MLTPSASRPDVPAAYGIQPVGTGDSQLLPWSWAEERLEGRYIWWLATTRHSGRPHLMPIWAVWLGDGVAFGTDPQSRKAKNIAHNNYVTIVPERGAQSVIVEGVVEPLAADRLDAYYAKYRAVWDTDIAALDAPAMLVRPKTVFGFVDEADGFPLSATRWSFE